MVSAAMGKINNKWGEFVITPALMMGIDDIILDWIAFGRVKSVKKFMLSQCLIGVCGGSTGLR
jgi:hypothetical protein